MDGQGPRQKEEDITFCTQACSWPSKTSLLTPATDVCVHGNIDGTLICYHSRYAIQSKSP